MKPKYLILYHTYLSLLHILCFNYPQMHTNNLKKSDYLIARIHYHLNQNAYLNIKTIYLIHNQISLVYCYIHFNSVLISPHTQNINDYINMINDYIKELAKVKNPNSFNFMHLYK